MGRKSGRSIDGWGVICYTNVMKEEKVIKPIKAIKPICSVKGCSKPQTKKSRSQYRLFCWGHYVKNKQSKGYQYSKETKWHICK